MNIFQGIIFLTVIMVAYWFGFQEGKQSKSKNY